MIAAIDIGGTKVAVGVVDSQGKVLCFPGIADWV